MPAVKVERTYESSFRAGADAFARGRSKNSVTKDLPRGSIQMEQTSLGYDRMREFEVLMQIHEKRRSN